METSPQETNPVANVVIPPVRVFEITFVGGAKEHQSAHVYDDTTLHLIFLDFVEVSPSVYVRRHRRTVAAGQWRDVREIGQTPEQQPRVH